MTDIKLRPYQRDFIDAVRAEFIQNHKRVVGVAPCGSGKTIMTGWMIKESLARNKRSIFFVHRHELIEQTSKTFTDLDIPHGIIAADKKMYLNLPVQIASVQTLANRLDIIPAPDFLICDECHHILANSYKKILDAFPDAYLLGVTATPLRMGDITLSDVFTSMVQSLSVNQLIKLGNLTPFRYFAPDSGVDLSNVKIERGDFSKKGLEFVMSNKHITGGIIDNYLKFANGLSAICYCVGVNHSKIVADAFSRAGIPAAHCDGDTDKKERAQIVDAFRRGDIKVLCNADLFGEGFDVPACQAVILARPTQSLTLFIQQSMRAMRPDPCDPDKVAVIIDHVQNYRRHGFPNDFHEWSLEPNKIKLVTCPNCGEKITPVIDSSLKRKKCPDCGFIFPKNQSLDTPKRQPRYRDGSLIELDVNYTDVSSPAADIIHAPSTPEEFLAIANRKNYKRYWVAIQSLHFANSYEDCLHIADVCGFKPGWAYYAWNKRYDDLIAKKTLAKNSLGVVK